MPRELGRYSATKIRRLVRTSDRAKFLQQPRRNKQMATVRDLRRCPKFDALFENIEVTEIERRLTDQGDIIVIYFESMTSDMLGGQITVTPEVAVTLDLPFPVPDTAVENED